MRQSTLEQEQEQGQQNKSNLSESVQQRGDQVQRFLDVEQTQVRLLAALYALEKREGTSRLGLEHSDL